jgi:hypothetical protein
MMMPSGIFAHLIVVHPQLRSLNLSLFVGDGANPVVL